jgi:hypothetical protein
MFPHLYDAWPNLQLLGEPWNWTDLVQAFEKLLKELTTSNKVALFIDGLDEFEGSHVELISLIRRTASPNIKICVTSRPWRVKILSSRILLDVKFL